MWFRIACAALGAVLLTAVPASAAAHTVADPASTEVASAVSTTVVIQSFAPSGPAGATDEFVELRNTSASNIDLSGWSLGVCFADQVTNVIGLSGWAMAPGERFLLTNWNFSGPAGAIVYGFDVPESGGWQLRDARGPVVDSVGLSLNACAETLPAQPCLWGSGFAVSRNQYGTDTDVNAADFTCQSRLTDPS